MKRSKSLDVFKLAAAFGVILIHLSGYGMKEFPLDSTSFMGCLFFNALGRFCVPAFLMVTGRLLLSSKKEIGPEKAIKSYAIPTLIILLFWGFVYAVFLNFGMTVLDGEKISLNLLFSSLADTFLFKHAGHLYYLLIIILVYLFLPALKVFISNASEEILKLTFYLWLIFAIIYPVLLLFKPFSLLGGWARACALYMPYSCIGYVFAGWYLSTKKSAYRKEAYLGVFALGVLVMMMGTYAFSKLMGELYMGFLEGAQLGSYLAAFGLYRYLELKFGDETSGALLTKLSDAGLTIYLVHYFITLILRAKGPDIHKISPFILIPLEAVFVYVLSYLIYQILKRIELFNKYLIRRG